MSLRGPVESQDSDEVPDVDGDHGPGIATEDLPKVFDRFYRAPSARGLPGSGLGLAIVAQVVRQHHGSVQIIQHAEGGTIVRIELPTVPEIESN
jgi:signal transduction histidine kinase